MHPMHSYSPVQLDERDINTKRDACNISYTWQELYKCIIDLQRISHRVNNYD